MSTFNLIIKKLINDENNFFSSKYKQNNDDINPIIKLYFKKLYDNIITNKYKNKFDFFISSLNDFYLKNDLNKTQREEFIYLFNKIQKTYHTINRLVYRYKYNKSSTIVETDLQLNDINLSENNIICIYHVNSKYLFRIEELLKMVYISLTNCYMFFSEPICVKNPYNNIPFNKSILYYIFYHIMNNKNFCLRNNDYLDLFLKFKECNFNITELTNRYEYLLRDYVIKNYLINSTKDVLREDINKMIKWFNSKFVNDYNHILISEDFPNDELIQIMKPYLHLKILSKYSLIGQIKFLSGNKLFTKLCEFQKFNPQFGRKIIKCKHIMVNGKKKIKSYIEFNMTHKKFNIHNIENFMTNHLEFNNDENVVHIDFETGQMVTYEEQYDEEDEQIHEEDNEEDDEDDNDNEEYDDNESLS